MHTIKYSRGPLAGKREVRPDLGMVRVSAPREDLKMSWMLDPYTPTIAREGSYIRSNVTLKDGTVVYEWMGWYPDRV